MTPIAEPGRHAQGDPECIFCDQHLQSSESPFDVVLGQTDTATLLPALGMIVPGYFLAITRTHVLSTAALTTSERLRFHGVVDDAVDFLEASFGSYIVFEHGSCASSGSCIAHAHAHLIPAGRDLEECLESSLPWQQISGVSKLQEHAREYAYLKTTTGHYFYDEAKLPSQWIRRMLAEHVGTDLWDWAVEPGRENLDHSLSRISSSSTAPLDLHSQNR